MSRDALLVADCVGKSFGRRSVLKNASLWVRPGAITAVSGRNGQGKSTLLMIAAGLLAPDYGAVRYGGEHYRRARLPDLAARGLFFLPEHSLLATSFTLRAQFAAFERRFGGDSRAAIDRLFVADLMDRLPTSLSSGERRRAEIALAVARQPDCLLADEPFARITPKDAELVADVLKHLAAAGCAIAVSGHEVESLFGVADEVLWMTAQTTHALGTPAEARVHHQFNVEYLGFGATAARDARATQEVES